MEAKSKSQSTPREDDGPNMKSKILNAAAEIGFAAFTALATGMAMAAGSHAYSAAARKLGGKPADVVPLRKVL